MPIDRPLFEPGDIVKHFKRETVSDLRSNDYLYKIVGEAKHTETDEPLIIYRALYGERKLIIANSMLLITSLDKEKYPDISQKYRFEKYEGQIFIE